VQKAPESADGSGVDFVEIINKGTGKKHKIKKRNPLPEKEGGIPDKT